MPIGFWAISRNDLQQLIAYKTTDHIGATNHFLDKAIRELQDNLEACLEELVNRYANEINKETAELQAKY